MSFCLTNFVPVRMIEPVPQALTSRTFSLWICQVLLPQSRDHRCGELWNDHSRNAAKV